MMSTFTNPHNVRSLAAACVALAATAAPLLAQIDKHADPEQIRGSKLEQHLKAKLPLDAEFRDESGKRVRLRDYFDNSKPVILTLNYYACPMLCNLQLNGLVDSLKEMDWTPGDQFNIVTLSFDPTEKPGTAKAKKRNYLAEYGKPAATRGWHFMTGDKDDIKAVTSAVGFHYYWNTERKEWAHPMTYVLCSPDGRIMRYLGDLSPDPKTLRLSLIEASDGKVGGLWDKVFLTCFHYISNDGKYTASVMGIMRLGAALTLVILGLAVLTLWLRELRRKKKALSPPTLPAV